MSDYATFFYSQDEDMKKHLMETFLENRGKCIKVISGMCGEIYILDLGENTTPRYICAKIPKQQDKPIKNKINKRFIEELEQQLSFYHHQFVHWAFDFKDMMDIPVALFRYWGKDLGSLLENEDVSEITKLSCMLYTCMGLRHCYNNGLNAHQDLKPANIFLRNMKYDCCELPDLDIFDFALIGDFGLANTSIKSNVFDGSRPYMAPEQWNKTNLSSATDIFALGIILYELMSNGYHPVGILLKDFWPTPKTGNTKKWTKSDEWKKWIKQGCEIKKLDNPIDSDLMMFIKQMLQIEPNERPTIDKVIDFLFKEIDKRSHKSYDEINFLISYYDSKANKKPLKEQWSTLFDTWEKFKKKYSQQE